MKKTSTKKFNESIKDDPKKIIKWAEGEIKAYKELIELIKSKTKAKRT